MPSKIFSLFFVLLWFIPPVFTFFHLDSYTISTVGIVFLFTIVNYLFEKKVAITKKFFSILSLALCFLIIHSFLAAVFFYKGYDLNRNLISIFFVLIFLIGAYNFGEVIKKLPDEFHNKCITCFFYFYIFLIALSFVTKVVPSKFGKPIFPYPEPSHLALFLGPVIAFMIISSKNSKRRILLLFSGFIIALIIKNMTLLVTMIIVSVFVYNIYVFPILFVSSFGLYFFSDLEYFSERIDFDNMHKTNNLSALVYMKGFQLIEEGLKMTNGWGVGFQQLGHVPIKTEIGDYLKSKMNGLELNSQDGGFTAAKVIAEFGIAGLLCIVIFIVNLIKQWNIYRKTSVNGLRSYQVLFFASIITIFSEFFFRGIGYFSASMFLFLTVIIMQKTQKT